MRGFNSPACLNETLFGGRVIQNIHCLASSNPICLKFFLKTRNSGHRHVSSYFLNSFEYIEIMQLKSDGDIPCVPQQTFLLPFLPLQVFTPCCETCLYCVQIIAAKRFHDWSHILYSVFFHTTIKALSQHSRTERSEFEVIFKFCHLFSTLAVGPLLSCKMST